LSEAIFINDKSGTILSVSKDKTSIKVLLPKGGIVKVRNEGFEKGEQVCLIANATKTKIVKVVPKLIADMTAALGSDPILKAATEEQPEDLEQDFDEYEYYGEDIIIEEGEEEHGSTGKTIRDGDEGEREAEFTLSDGS